MTVDARVICWLADAHAAFKARARLRWAKNREKKAAQRRERMKDPVKHAKAIAHNRADYQKHKAKRTVTAKKWREKNRDAYLQLMRRYYAENKERYNNRAKEWRKNNPDWDREYRLKNLAKHRADDKAYRKRRFEQFPELRLEDNLRTRLRSLAKQVDGESRRLGIAAREIREAMERKFKPGMTWQNYGLGDGRWHIDHIVPCSKFDLTKPADIKKCFALSNLQPLWGRENIQKSNKVMKQAELTL